VTAGFDIGELSPAAFSHPVEDMRVVETHISWIVLTGQYAYKIKKPLRYDFLDAGTLERRRALCHEELRLNRRLAPELYLDVTAIVREAGCLRVASGGDAVEYAVRMRQFDPAQELSNQLSTGAVTPHEMTSLATVLAEFHGRAAVAPSDSPFGGLASVRAQILDNMKVLERHVEATDEEAAMRRLDDWQRTLLAQVATLITSRKRAGAVRECHGDLHTRNIVRWAGEWLPFDCIEFSAELRFIDVMSDVAFLYMDLGARGRRDLAHVLLSAYVEATGDYEGLRLVTLFAVYRALVRAKIDALGSASVGAELSGTLRARCAERIRVARELIADRRPALLITHGVTGCGKSWLSEQLVPALPAVRIRSDLERKRMAGIGVLESSGSGVGENLYAEQVSDRVYGRLGECAEAALAGGFDVVVDAAFLRQTDRERFRQIADARRCRFLMVSCHADQVTLRARVQKRARMGNDASEASLAVLDHQLSTQQVLTLEERAHALSIDTGGRRSAEACIADVRARLSAPT
jgi:hypothetical protein